MARDGTARVPGALRFVEREARIYRRLWRADAFSSFLLPALFLGAMGLGLGGLVDERAGDVDGLDYLVFVTPGLLAATTFQMGAVDALWPTMAGFKWLRHFHAMVAAPLAPSDVLGGQLAWEAIRTAMQAVVFLAVAAVLGGVPSWWGVLAVPAAVLVAVAVHAPVAAFAATQENDQAFLVLVRLVIQPMFLFSGTFFPVDQLPDALEVLAVATPLWHGVELCRGATTGTLEALPAIGHVAYLLAVLSVGVWAGRRTFGRRLVT